MPVPDTGQKLVNDVTSFLQGSLFKEMNEFDERRIQRDIESIPNDHYRFMCWGMFYSIKKEAKQSIENHQYSIKIGATEIGYNNFIASLYSLRDWAQALEISTQYAKAFPSTSAKISLAKALFGNGYYCKALTQLEEIDQVETQSLLEKAKLMTNVLGESYEQAYASFHQAFIKHCFQSKNIFISEITPVGLIDPETGQQDIILQVFQAFSKDNVDLSNIVPSFLTESDAVFDVSFELMSKVSFSIEAIKPIEPIAPEAL